MKGIKYLNEQEVIDYLLSHEGMSLDTYPTTYYSRILTKHHFGEINGFIDTIKKYKEYEYTSYFNNVDRKTLDTLTDLIDEYKPSDVVSLLETVEGLDISDTAKAKLSNNIFGVVSLNVESDLEKYYGMSMYSNDKLRDALHDSRGISRVKAVAKQMWSKKTYKIFNISDYSGITITKKELEVIRSLTDKNERKLLYGILNYTKVNELKTGKVGWTNVNIKKIAREMGFRGDDVYETFYKLKEKGLVSMKSKTFKKSIYNSSDNMVLSTHIPWAEKRGTGEVMTTITNFKDGNIKAHFNELEEGGVWKNCHYCGMRFKVKGAHNTKYCSNTCKKLAKQNQINKSRRETRAKLKEGQLEFHNNSIKFADKLNKIGDDRLLKLLKSQDKDKELLLKDIKSILKEYTVEEFELLGGREKARIYSSLTNKVNGLMNNEIDAETGELYNLLIDIGEDKYLSNSYLLSLGVDFSLTKISGNKLRGIINRTVVGESWSNRLYGNKQAVAKKLQTDIYDFLYGRTNQDTMIKNINRDFDINKSTTTRLVRNEVARVQTEVNEVWMEDHKEFIPSVMWSATLDSKTSSICQEFDGQVWDRDSKHPKPVQDSHINCRCCLVALPSPDWKPTDRRDNETGEIINYQSYKQWKEKNNL